VLAWRSAEMVVEVGVGAAGKVVETLPEGPGIQVVGVENLEWDGRID
jgi:hypothetical protein